MFTASRKRHVVFPAGAILLPISILVFCACAVGEPPADRVRVQFHHDHPVFDLTFSPDGRILAAVGYDRSNSSGPAPADSPPQLRAWDMVSGKEVFSARCHAGRAQALAFSPDGRILVTSGEDGKLCFWDVAAKKTVRAARSIAGSSCVQFSVDGKYLAAVERGREAQIVNFGTGKEICRIRPTEFGVTRVAFSPDGMHLASASGDDLDAHLWDTITGKELKRFKGRERNVIPLAFLPDGKTLVTGASEIRLWEVVTGNERLTIRCVGNGFSVAPNGRVLAAVDDKYRISLFATADGKELGVLGAHKDDVHAVSFSPDGRFVATGGEDGSIIVWNVATLASNSDPAVQLSAEKCAMLWDCLAGNDAGDAYRAVVTLSRGPDRVPTFLQERLRHLPLPKLPTEEKMARLLMALGADQYAEREAASRAIAALGAAAAPHLQVALTRALMPEARRRLEYALKQAGRPSPAELQTIRAIETMERTGTSQAVRALEGLANRRPETLLTQQANESLLRLSRCLHAKTQPERGSSP